MILAGQFLIRAGILMLGFLLPILEYLAPISNVRMLADTMFLRSGTESYPEGIHAAAEDALFK